MNNAKIFKKIVNIPGKSNINYNIIDLIGKRGTFGTILKALDLDNDRYIAIKKISKAKKDKDFKERIKYSLYEVNSLIILSSKGNKYITKYYDCFKTEDFLNFNMYIISEFIEGYTFKELIKKFYPIDMNHMHTLIYQLILGAEFIHIQGFAHRDIKTDNLMFSPNERCIKYVDFGFSCVEKDRDEYKNCINTCTKFAGTIFYTPPECIVYKKIVDENGHSINNFLLNVRPGLASAQKHDVWSLGIVIYELANGVRNFPYELNNSNSSGDNREDAMMAIMFAPTKRSNYIYDSDFTNQLLDFMLINSPEDRPTIWEIKKYFDDKKPEYAKNDT